MDDVKPIAGPKRPWFRFHLLTAVLMMLAAGGFLWLNFLSHTAPKGLDGAWQGFPYPAYLALHYDGKLSFGDTGSDFIVSRKESIVIILGAPHTVRENGWCYAALATNVVVCGFGVLVVALVSEALLRRREGHKP